MQFASEAAREAFSAVEMDRFEAALVTGIKMEIVLWLADDI